MDLGSRTLLDLPSELLLVILDLVLDEPNGPYRAAVLSTNSLLHELGTPLLFKHVRLATFASWESMFRVGGVLSPIEDGGMGMGKYVKELQLDRLDEQDADWSFPVSPSLQLPSVHTLTLSHHLLQTWTLYPHLPPDFSDFDFHSLNPRPHHHRRILTSLLSFIFVRLPSVKTVRYLASPDPTFPNSSSSGRDKYHSRSSVSSLLGLTDPSLPSNPPTTPFPFPQLRTIHLDGNIVLDDPRPQEYAIRRATSFSTLPMVETLIITFKWTVSQAASVYLYECLLRGSLKEERETRFAGLRRIEIRGGRVDEQGSLEERLRLLWEDAAEERGLLASERRLGPLVVFVDEEGGEERWLVDREEDGGVGMVRYPRATRSDLVSFGTA